MKIIEAITRADALSANSYSPEQKLQWLSTLDKNIFTNVIKTHKDAAVTEFNGYDRDTNLHSTDLLAEDTFCDMYVFYLLAQIDLYNREYNGYNNNVLIYDSRYKEYEAWYNRTHYPITETHEVFF